MCGGSKENTLKNALQIDTVGNKHTNTQTQRNLLLVNDGRTLGLDKSSMYTVQTRDRLRIWRTWSSQDLRALKIGKVLKRKNLEQLWGPGNFDTTWNNIIWEKWGPQTTRSLTQPPHIYYDNLPLVQSVRNFTASWYCEHQIRKQKKYANYWKFGTFPMKIMIVSVQCLVVEFVVFSIRIRCSSKGFLENLLGVARILTMLGKKGFFEATLGFGQNCNIFWWVFQISSLYQGQFLNGFYIWI